MSAFAVTLLFHLKVLNNVDKQTFTAPTGVTPDAIYLTKKYLKDFSDKKWKTKTTKNRLNAILSEFNSDLSIFQRGGEWYIDYPFGRIAWQSHSIAVFEHPDLGKVLRHYEAGRMLSRRLRRAA